MTAFYKGQTNCDIAPVFEYDAVLNVDQIVYKFIIKSDMTGCLILFGS